MSCQETRELLSAWLDEALDVRERAAVDAHLAGCADCRRELEGLRSTVSLLSRVEPARAPDGFVDRVMAEAHPTPWYVRLARVIFFPLSIKLPIEAGAMIVIAVLGVYLLQSAPELKDAARPDVLAPTAPTSRSEPSPPPAPPAPHAPASAPTPAQPPAVERDAELRKALPPASGDKRERFNVAPPAGQAQSVPEKRREAEQEAAPPPAAAPPAQERAKAVGPLPRTAAPASPEPREANPAKTDPAKADSDRKGALAAPSPMMSAKQQAAPPSVTSALTVKDRQEAERALGDLIARTGAQEIGRRQDAGATVVDVVVPQAAYAGFTKDLAGLGSLRIDGPPAETAQPVRLSIRISE